MRDAYLVVLRICMHLSSTIHNSTYFSYIQNCNTFDNVSNFCFTYTDILEHSCNLKQAYSVTI